MLPDLYTVKLGFRLQPLPTPISPVALDDMFSSPLIAALQMNPERKVSVVQAMRYLPHRSLDWGLADHTILPWSTKITPALLLNSCAAEPCGS
jgi:hypothetical protein